MNILASETVAGQAVYTDRTLRLYDGVVLGLSNQFVWRCPTRALREFYDENLTANHLDVGVGTGYFLDRCRFPHVGPRIVLMDLNESCLTKTAARIARYHPQTVRRDVLQPINFEGELFDSIGVNYVLHCLPGRMKEKAIVFDHLRPLLKPGGVLFGSTLLSAGVSRNFLARRLMNFYNQRGIFCNQGDSLAELEASLRDRFQNIEIRTRGCGALFRVRMPIS